MKDKKNIGSKIAIVIISLVVLVVVCLSPNLIGRLLGSVNSVDTSSGEGIKTGVVIDTNLILDSSNEVTLKIYNGAESDITVNSYIWRNTCKFGCDSENFNVINLDTPITIKANSEEQYVISDAKSKVSALDNNGVADVGVQYVLEGKVYNLFSFVGNLSDFNPNLNSGVEEQTSEEFVFQSKHNTEGKDDIFVTLSDNDIHMDISEDLSSLNLTYKLKSDFSNSWTFESPIKESAFAANMFGEPNKSNIKDFLYVRTNDESISGKGAFDYSSGKQFSINGTPKHVMTHQTIIPTFYFQQYKNKTFGGVEYRYVSDLQEDYLSVKIPQFSLTVYDKSGLLTAANNAIERIKSYAEEDVDFDSWYNYAYLVYQNAFNLYESRDFYGYCSTPFEGCETKEITQAEIDRVIDELNNYTFQKKASADYTAYNELVSKIESKQESWYTPESYAKFKVVYDERSNYQDITEAYQSKLNNYVKKLQDAFSELEMLDADYSAVDAAITSANLINNKTEDGKYDKYTEESWNALLDAINGVDRSLKIENQDIVNGYAVAISNAQAGLVEADAIYDDLNEIIAQYRDTEAYINNWYTDETKNPVEDYLKKITFDKKITEQAIVDTWVEELTPLVEALKLKKALGYLDADNYKPFEGALSVEGYINYLRNLDRSLYTEETLEGVDDIINMYEDGTDEIFNLTIDRQEEMDEFLKEFDFVIKYNLEKKPGDYTELCKYYKEALELNLDYYEDVFDLRQALWDINWDYKIDEQDKIDEEAENLRKIINNLVMKLADYTEFNKAYEKAKSLNANYYVDFSKVQVAIANANKATGLKIDKQAIVDEATNSLNEAMNNLALKDADYSKINTLKSVIEQLDESKYTNFEIVKKALNAVEYGKKANEQKLVDQMYNELKNAYDNLQKTRANYSELEKAVENAKKYEPNKNNYTNYSELEKIINSINYTLSWENQDKVDNLTKKINDAVSNLRKKSADYSELSNVLSKIPSDYSEFDKALQNEIKSLLNEARALPSDLKIDEQSKIDALVSKIKLLLEKLPSSNINENSNNVVLSYLKVNGNKVNISKAPFKYTVEYGVVEAKIDVGLASSSSTSKVYGGNVLMPGDNNITIVVTTKDGKTYTYTLIVTRKIASDYLSDLSVKGNDIEFSKTKQEYTVKVDKKTNKLDLSAIAEDENAKVNIKGNKNIKNGSKVTIEVESTDGSVRVYTLNVQKTGSVDVGIILILIMILAILAAIFKFVQEKQKVNKNVE